MEHNTDSPNNEDRSAYIGPLRIPFPFSCVVSLLFLPVLLIGGVLSIPMTALHQHLQRERERKFLDQMAMVSRVSSWAAVRNAVPEAGTLIGEYHSPKGPFRIWWTEESISECSPHPCCFEELPWVFESTEFFDWCAARYTDATTGTAVLIEVSDSDRDEMRRLLLEWQSRQRYVTIRPPRSASRP